MQSRRSAIQKSNGSRRRKSSLCCEPCRERKSRCDGRKPICGPCTQRSHAADRCLYRRNIVRLLDTDEYLQVLYRHIRELEEVCHEAGIPVPTFNPDVLSMDSDGETPQIGLGIQFDAQTTLPGQGNSRAFPPPIKPETFPSLLTNPQEGDLNLLKASNLIGGNEGFSKQSNKFLGSPPTACLIRLLTQGPLLRDIPYGPTHTHLDGSLLPPRDLADHLLGCFWDRVYCLYPFFDRSSVQDAYEGLWISGNAKDKKASKLNIGLGGRSDSGRQSPVFICALNTMFALGCHFADFSVPDRNAIAHTFFLRAKQNIGLDLLEIRTFGAVQTLLLASLYLQSIPDSHKSRDLVGVACKIVQGLEFHDNQPDSFKDPFELEIQRRTWHGCVMMDTIVGMACGRPSTTSSLPAIPLPGAVGLTPTNTKDPYLTAFYPASLELCSILETALSAVHKARCDRSSTPARSTAVQQDGLDVVVKLEEKLSKYESSLPSFLSWNRPFNPATDVTQLLTLRRQRNVLHARFLYLRLRLYRAAFTQLCSEMLAQEDSETDQHDPALWTLYPSMLFTCAVACVKAAIDLVSLVYDNYQTSATDTWWHNGFYTSVAGMVLVMSYTCLPALPDIEKTAVNGAWRKCEQILQFMIPYNFSSRNTLLFLRAARDRILSYLEEEIETGATDMGPDSSLVDDMENPFVDEADGLFNGANWLGSAVAMVGLGFLCPADFKWFQDWLAEELP
ncbi:fungal-specific transcription factor domain-containing protein [Aspergillus caelatus]|uniref:Fungal-specific transcription factor domain-containing protein n=1 Tax=Aspergillus caelatus TaxID=61420 RepID=A0A5N7ADW4_9EURO|nr:fungal-specific transcription factor domain-containing protein [Aspergillus caelatus]KAE8368022.1 fungal-specific transcription factor domain-containing protein [Aspergillus caelatus]